MPFSWYHPDLPVDAASTGEKATAMYVEEVRTRAALLMRLGFTKAETKLRLRGNVRWDFELNDHQPAHFKQINSIVEKVYSTRGSGVAGPPTI